MNFENISPDFAKGARIFGIRQNKTLMTQIEVMKKRSQV